MRKRFWKGLRTIELAIATVIICMVLAVIAGNYDEFKCRSIESEAKFALQEVYAAQLLYFNDYERFASIDKLKNLDKRVDLPLRYYALRDVKAPNANSFLVSAEGVKGSLVEGEIWHIDQENHLTLMHEACKRP